MARQTRAWQRSLKNGQVEAFVAGGGASMRVIAYPDDARRLVDSFMGVTGAEVTFDSPIGAPQTIEGQTDIYEQLGQT